MATTWWLYVKSLQNVLACPLMQLGDGDGERGEDEDGDEEDGEGQHHQTSPIKVILLCVIW